MKRDDFGMRIDNIRELATKYSKPELGNMVKMGMVSPQEALMAGMMIDRITKSAMQPPQTTVAEDVLGQQQAPQGMMAAPGAPPPSAGVAALPSGIQNMAGGGIVAFADGGDTDYADGGAVGFADRGYVDPEFRTKDPEKIRQAKYNILAEELRNQQAAIASSEGEDKLRAIKNLQAIQREMRSLKPAVDPNAGIGALIPSAQAATPMAAKAPAPAVEDEGSYDPMTGLKITGPEPKPYNPAIKPGTVYEPNPIRDILQGGPGQPKPEATKPAAPIPPTKFEVQPAPAPEPSAPAEEKAAPVLRAEPPQPREAEQIKVPEETTFGKEYSDVQEAYKQAGVDTDMYKKMMSELEGKKAGFGKRKEQALGAALMAFGLGLAGARKGQVFQQLGSEGQKALGMYVNEMDKITENENKIDVLNNQLRMAENNFKRTGADSALAQVRARKERIDQIEAKNADMREKAAQHADTIKANVYHTDIWAQVTSQNAAQNVAARLAAALGANKGGFTDKQLSDLYDKVEMENRGKLEDLFKDKGSKAQIEKEVKDKLLDMTIQRANEIRGMRQKGNIPVPSSGAGQWNVQGGVD